MLRYIIRRILYAIPVLFIITVIVFSLIHLIPGDPVRMIFGVRATQEKVAVVKAELNLDKPIYIQYYIWIKGVLKGDFGDSLRSNEPVLPTILPKLVNTFILTMTSLIFSIIVSIIFGVIAASRRNTMTDFTVMGVAIFGISIPIFWSGIISILFFSSFLHILPSMGYVSFIKDPIAGIRHLILPAGVLGFALTSYTTRMTRSQMIDVLNQDYVITARAKGLGERLVIYKHALKNALIPIVTAIGLEFGYLMGGQVLIEQIFAWPGIGKLVVNAIFNRDYTIIQGVVLVVAVIFVFVNLLVDITYAFLNPKIRYK